MVIELLYPGFLVCTLEIITYLPLRIVVGITLVNISKALGQWQSDHVHVWLQ